MPTSFSRTPVIWIIVVAAVAAALGLWLGQRQLAPERIALQAATLYPEPRAPSPFELTRGDGSSFTRSDLAGAWTLMFFGFTHCPDICPTTLATFAQVERELARDAGAPPVAYAFVSVDPERDTPAVVGEYARYFSPAIVALTGEPATLQRFTRELGIVYMKSPPEGGDYTIDHSAAIVLIDPQGRRIGQFQAPHDPGRIVADLKHLARSG